MKKKRKKANSDNDNRNHLHPRLLAADAGHVIKSTY